MKENLKLFVWTNVLRDYTPGIIFALAETPDEARKIIIEYTNCNEYVAGEIAKEPDVHEDKVGFVCWGGG